MNPKKHSAAIVPKNQAKNNQGKFQQWLNSLSNLLGEITALEINTAIVAEIIPEQFVPWEIYQQLYSISRQNLQQNQIHPSLCDRYLQLRRQLELAYSLLLIDPHSELYQPALKSQLQQNLIQLSQSGSDWEHLPTQLPPPIPNQPTEQPLLVFQLLHNYQFLRTLHQLGSIKTALDRQNQLLKQSESKSQLETADTVYAQTLIQLDGKIINRYCEQIFNHPHQAQILELHHRSIKAGQQQWRLLLDFIIHFINPKN